MKSSGARDRALDFLLMLCNGSGQIAKATSVLDAALSANVPLKNAANVFSAGQTINAATALTLSDAAGTGDGTITTVAAKNLLLNPGAAGWVSITPSNAVSALDLYQSKTGDGVRNAGSSSLRVSRNGSPYDYDLYMNGGVYQSVWLVLSGLTTGTGDTFECQLPAEDLSMLAIQPDVAGAAVQTNSLDGISPVFEVVEGNPASVASPQLTSTKYNFAIGPNGALYWGNTARLYNTGANWTVAVATNVCTIDCQGAHGFVVGGPMHIRNFTDNTFVNNMTVTVTAITANTVSFALTHADQIATTETATGAELKGRYDVGLRRTGAGALALTDGGTGAGTSLTAALVGNVTGNCSGSSGSCTGNAATATTATNITLGTTRPYDYILIQDQKAQNTAGDALAAASGFQTRTLNTEVTDTGNLATLAANQITLAAGTYEARIEVTAYRVDRHQSRLQNVTGATTVLLGSTEYNASASDYATNKSIIVGRFTIAADQALEVQTDVQTDNGTNGGGLAGNMATEIYTSVELRRVGL